MFGKSEKKNNSAQSLRKYTPEWIASLSDEDFYKEREPVRLAHCHGDENATNILEIFNEIEITRMNKKFKAEHPDWEQKEHKRWTDAARWEKD